MSNDPFFSFLALVTQDTHALTTRKKIAHLVHKREERTAALTQLQDRLTDLQSQAHRSKKNLDAQELEIKILKERQRALKSKLDFSSSPKEYFSLESELKTLSSEIDLQENRLFELFEQFETVEKKRVEIDFQVVTLRQQTLQDTAALDQEIVQLTQQLEQYRESFEELMPHVNPDMLEKFLSMKNVVENPVVHVEKNACSACFNTVSMQDLVSMRKHKLVSCQNCFRLLYVSPA